MVVVSSGSTVQCAHINTYVKSIIVFIHDKSQYQFKVKSLQWFFKGIWFKELHIYKLKLFNSDIRIWFFLTCRIILGHLRANVLMCDVIFAFSYFVWQFTTDCFHWKSQWLTSTIALRLVFTIKWHQALDIISSKLQKITSYCLCWNAIYQ